MLDTEYLEMNFNINEEIDVPDQVSNIAVVDNLKCGLKIHIGPVMNNDSFQKIENKSTFYCCNLRKKVTNCLRFFNLDFLILCRF